MAILIEYKREIYSHDPQVKQVRFIAIIKIAILKFWTFLDLNEWDPVGNKM